MKAWFSLRCSDKIEWFYDTISGRHNHTRRKVGGISEWN